MKYISLFLLMFLLIVMADLTCATNRKMLLYEEDSLSKENEEVNSADGNGEAVINNHHGILPRSAYGANNQNGPSKVTP